MGIYFLPGPIIPAGEVSKFLGRKRPWAWRPHRGGYESPTRPHVFVQHHQHPGQKQKHHGNNGMPPKHEGHPKDCNDESNQCHRLFPR